MATSSPDPLTRELEVACRLAREAGDAVEAIRREGFDSERKKDTSLVTRADVRADQILRNGFAEAFPEDGLLSEETEEGVVGRSGRTWVLDPLDGTRGFVHDERGYAIQIGLLRGGEPVLGVVYEPREEVLYRAARGAGAHLEEAGAAPRPLHVSERERDGDMPLVTTCRIDEERRRELLDRTGLRDGGRYHSVGVKVGLLVRGDADVYVNEHSVSLWDSCGPLVLLQEAGGRLTLPDGRPLGYDLDRPRAPHDGPFLASNGARHDALLRDVAGPLGW